MMPEARRLGRCRAGAGAVLQCAIGPRINVMRLSFANGERADFVMEGGAVHLGSAEGNGLVLADRDIAPWHARIVVDARGIVLEIMDPNARAHVNARPVREKAMLRCGDVLCLGRTTIALKADSDDAIATAIPGEATTPMPPMQPPRAVLRGVAGRHFGKAVAVNPLVVVGSSAGADLVVDDRIAPQHAAIAWIGDALWLRDLGSADGTLVNGVRVRNARLHAGDQIGFDRSHFVVEAPGMPARHEIAAATRDERAAPDEAVADAGPAVEAQGGIWWLIGAAALIALALVLLLHRGI